MPPAFSRFLYENEPTERLAIAPTTPASSKASRAAEWSGDLPFFGQPFGMIQRRVSREVTSEFRSGVGTQSVMILTSGYPLERIRELPPGVAYMPKPWQPLNVLIAAEQALASRGDVPRYPAIARVFTVFERA